MNGDIAPPIKTRGARLIAAERERQIIQEGWTPEHDDQHDDGVLVRAALCYADKAAVQTRGHRDVGELRPVWPWEQGWWKPSDDPIRNLVKAGALIAAEIDRLQRMQDCESELLVCACGHEYDEHDDPSRSRGAECCVDGCDCIHFEETDPNEWDQ